MPLYVDDYLADTFELERHEHGAYLLLILAYWKNRGPLADDDEVLRRLAKASRREWSSIRSMVSPFFEITSGFWRHGRIDHELQKAAGVSMAAAENAKLSNIAQGRGDVRETRSRTRSRHVRVHEQDRSVYADETLDTQPTTTSSTSAIAPVEETAFPVGLDSAGFRAAWLDWLAYRREAKLGKWKPRTVSAKLAEMAGWGEAAAIESIRSSIANGWQGLFEPKVAAGATFAQIRPQPKVDPLPDARRKLRALVEAVAEGAEVAVDAAALHRAEMCATAAEVDELTKAWIAANRPTIEASGVWR